MLQKERVLVMKFPKIDCLLYVCGGENVTTHG